MVENWSAFPKGIKSYLELTKGNDFYLINIFTLDTIASVASWTLSTLPGTIRITGALGSRKTGVRQAPI